MSAIPNPLTNRPNAGAMNSGRTGSHIGEPQYSQFVFWLTVPRRVFIYDVPDRAEIQQVTQQVPQIQLRPVAIAQFESPSQRVHVQSVESSEAQWLREHSRALGNYRGEWLLIREGELLAHDQDFAAIRSAIHEHGILSPFVYYVPLEEESNFLIL